MNDQWSPGVVVAVALFACGLAVGAVATAILFSPFEAIETLSKTQNIFAASVAFIAAVIAYKAQKAKIKSDETSRRQDQESKIDAVREECTGRMDAMLEWFEHFVPEFESATTENVAQQARIAHELIGPSVNRAVGRLEHIWDGVEKAPRELRRGLLQFLLHYETFLERAEDYVQMTSRWKDYQAEDVLRKLVPHSTEITRYKLKHMKADRIRAIESS